MSKKPKADDLDLIQTLKMEVRKFLIDFIDFLVSHASSKVRL